MIVIAQHDAGAVSEATPFGVDGGNKRLKARKLCAVLRHVCIGGGKMRQQQIYLHTLNCCGRQLLWPQPQAVNAAVEHDVATPPA